MIPAKNKSTAATKTTTTAIDHIVTNGFVEYIFKNCIIYLDISRHFVSNHFINP